MDDQNNNLGVAPTSGAAQNSGSGQVPSVQSTQAIPSVPPAQTLPPTVPGGSLSNELDPTTGISNQSMPSAIPAGFGSSGGVSTNDISQTMPPSVPVSSATPVLTSSPVNQVTMENPLNTLVPPVDPVMQNVAPVAESQIIPAAPLTPLAPPVIPPVPAGPVGDIQPKSTYSPFIDDEGNTSATPPLTSPVAAPSAPPVIASSAPDNSTVPQSSQVSPVIPVPDAVSSDVPPIAADLKPKSRIGLIVTLSVLGLVAIMAVIVALTEFGFISFGFEKVYGKVGLEQLWGGLSIKSETGLAQSLAAMSNKSDYKMNGSIDLTINKSQSNVVTNELLSKIGSSLARVDQKLSTGIITEAALAIADEEVSSSDETGLYSSSTASDSASSYDYSGLISSTGAANSSSVSSSSTLSSATAEQTNQQAYTSKDASSLKEVSVKIGANFAKDGFQADLGISRSIGSADMSILSRDGLIATKSDTFLFGEDANIGSWNQYAFGNKDTTFAEQISGINVDSGVSVAGSRISNEKIDGKRCYKYHINSMILGTSLSDFNVDDNMIQSIQGDVWIEISTKLLRKIELKIVMSPSMPVTQIDTSLTLSDFDKVNTIDNITSNLSSSASDSSFSVSSSSSSSSTRAVSSASSSSAATTSNGATSSAEIVGSDPATIYDTSGE
ncbi:MAG: hypothetical protein WCG48_00325 [Candidatus Berkelbacteria bacterium]